MSGNGWKGIVEAPTEIHQRYKTSKPKKIVGKSSRSSYLVPGQIFLSCLTLRAPVTPAALAEDRGICIDLTVSAVSGSSQESKEIFDTAERDVNSFQSDLRSYNLKLKKPFDMVDTLFPAREKLLT